MPASHRVLVFVLLLVLLCPVFARAGGDEAPDNGPVVRVGAGHVGRADLEDDRGAVAVNSGWAQVQYGPVRFDYAVDAYDWEDVDELPLGNGSDDPWDSLHQASLSLSHSDFVSRQWGWFASAAAGAAWEKDMDDSFSAGLGGGALYQWSDSVVVRAGAHVSVHAVGVTVLPALGLSINQGAAGRGEEGWSASLGVPVTEVRYGWSGQWATRLSAAYESTLYRLADDSDVERKGYLGVSAVRLGLYQDWLPVEALRLTLGLEYRFLRGLDVYNDDGEHRNGYGVDAAPGVAFGARYAF